MNTSGIKSISALSGSGFYQKIINKYRIGKIKTLRFPTMIFHKNRGYLFHKKINMSILLQMHFDNQNTLLPLIVKIIHSMKGMHSWLDSEKKNLQPILKLKNIQNVSNVKNFFTSNVVFDQQTAPITNSSNIIVNPQILLYYENKMKILNSQAFRMRINCINNQPLDTIEHSTSVNKETTHKYQSKSPVNLSQDNLFLNSTILKINKLLIKDFNQVTANKPFRKDCYGSFGYDSSSSLNRTYANKTGYFGSQIISPAILSQDNLFFKSTTLRMNNFLFKDPNQVTVNKPQIKTYYESFRYISPSYAKKTYAYKTESEIMRFQDTGHLEQEIEQIKKIVIQTKESMSEKTKPSLGEAEIKRYLDINRISDQVYQNIERTIRMERERRGM